jgi:hypothetical protein
MQWGFSSGNVLADAELGSGSFSIEFRQISCSCLCAVPGRPAF